MILGCIRSESMASHGLFDDPAALVDAVLGEVRSMCERQDVAPVGALTVGMFEPVFTNERAYWWELVT